VIDVVFYEVFKEEEVCLKKYLPKELKVEFYQETIQEAKHSSLPASVISIRTQSIIPKQWSKDLSGIITRSQGYDHLINFLKTLGSEIPCGYLGNYSSRSVAEHAAMTMMILLRKYKRQTKQFVTFNRNDITGNECLGKNVLVVGVGNIGSQIVDMVKGLKMPVKGVDVKKRLKDLQYVNLSSGLAWADVVFCALSLNKQTQGMLSYDVLSKARPGCVFINISRGEISPLKDLKRLLEEKMLNGLAMDVFEDEQIVAGELRDKKIKKSKLTQELLELKKLDNVVMTPHNAFNTIEALDRKSKLTADSVTSFLKRSKFPNSVPIN